MKNKNILRSEILAILLFVSVFIFGCVPNEANNSANSVNSANNANASANSGNSSGISTTGDPDQNLSQEEVDKGRLDQGWKQYVQIEASDEPSAPHNESLADITPENMNNKKMHLPLNSGEGPSVLRVQLLLDRSPFSPGILDGLWGKNTEKAVYWLQKREGIKATGTVNQQTFQRLFELAGSPDKMIVEHKLTEKDVSGPFVKIPSDIYEQAKLDCMCYETLQEKLGEMFHVAPDLLQRLNPKVELNNLKAGDTIFVPNLQNADQTTAAKVTKLVISDGGHYVHAVDKDGKVLYHFPSTLGSSYAPSPTGEWKIIAIATDPTWHYQPDLLTGVPDGKPDAIIPPGPNNPVGKVWMDLSKEHYGIHGTKAPETIGYATSHGCVRLTNWDAVFLAEKVGNGTTVSFTDTQKGNQQSGNSNSK